MRLAGTLTDQHDAATLVDFLYTLGIDAQAERNGEQWDLWVKDEERVADAKAEIAAHRANPQDAKYRAAVKQADQMRREKLDQAFAARRNIIDLSKSRTGRISARRRPLTMLILFAAAAVFAMTGFGTKDDVINKLLMSSAPQEFMPDLPEIRQGEWWRLLTPMLLHADILHFVFNMMCLVNFGSQIEMRKGTFRFGLLVLFCELTSDFAQFFWEGPHFVGMSGMNYGLFGYLWVKSQFCPWDGFVLHPNTIVLMFAWLFICMTGMVGPVADAGHVGGLVAGALLGLVPSRSQSNGS